MLDLESLKGKYSEKSYKEIVETNNLLLDKFSEKSEIVINAKDIAELVINLKLDSKSVSASMIFPFLKAGLINIDEFKDEEVKLLLSMLLKCESLSANYSDADGLKEMLLAITKDIRVIIIKSAEMLVFARKNVHNTKDIQAITAFKAIDDIFSPISARLGLSEIKSEFQDLSFEFHDPETFEKLKIDLNNEVRANGKMMDSVVSEINKLMETSSIKSKVYGRIKHISSINNKIKAKKVALKNIYDICAVRILVDSVNECYMALGFVHANFVPVDGRFKDYIANPKPNGYKSLHTTVYYDNEFFEVQIRTHEMHDFAEYGVAAHFLYKEHKKSLAAVDNKLLWIRKLLENKENVSGEKLLEELKTDVYLGEIFVQSPKGKVIKLVENATPIDFAYAIHSDVGNYCTGARVNGMMVPLMSTLSNGDVVEILTSSSSKGPSRDWLKFVKMTSTKDKINYFYKKQMKDENIKLGKVMVEQYAKTCDVGLSQILKEEWVSQILKKNSFADIDEMYAAIGYGSMTAEKFVNRLINMKNLEEQKTRTILDELPKNPVKVETKTDIIGAEGTLTKYCKCCNPIPGDNIVGYVSRGRGIIIHKKTCENVEKLAQDRFIKVDWNLNKSSDFTFTSYIDIVAKNNSNIYIELTNALSELSIKVTSLNSNQNKLGELILKIGVLVKDKSQLVQVKNKLASLGSVYEVLS